MINVESELQELRFCGAEISADNRSRRRPVFHYLPTLALAFFQINWQQLCAPPAGPTHVRFCIFLRATQSIFNEVDMSAVAVSLAVFSLRARYFIKFKKMKATSRSPPLFSFARENRGCCLRHWRRAPALTRINIWRRREKMGNRKFLSLTFYFMAASKRYNVYVVWARTKNERVLLFMIFVW
jgi:hypothetical protein